MSLLKIIKYTDSFSFELNTNYENFWLTVQRIENKNMPGFIFENEIESDYITEFKLKQVEIVLNKVNLNNISTIETFASNLISKINNKFVFSWQLNSSDYVGVYFYYIKFNSGLEFKSELFELYQCEPSDILDLISLEFDGTKVKDNIGGLIFSNENLNGLPTKTDNYLYFNNL